MKISGFISYSHADGKSITNELDIYLEDLLPNFQAIFDEDVPEGEKLERIKEKLSLCRIFILLITPASLKSKAVAEEVEIAKKLDMKIIPCKDKYVKQNWSEMPWDISNYKGMDFVDVDELKRKLVFSLSELLDDLESETIPTRTKIESSLEVTENNIPLIIQTDKSVYLYNTDMICTIIDPEKDSTEPINLKIFNGNNEIVYKNSIPINSKGNGIYQEVILIGGDNWTKKPGSQYVIVADHEGKSAKLSFLLTDFGMTIELDQKVYTWTDKVYITVVAPDLVRDFNKIEKIGNNKESSVEIKTRKGKLENYELVETGPGTGIFIGEVILTGFADYNPLGTDANQKATGNTIGKGPTRGFIAADDDDGITVTLTTPYNSVSGSALIRWNFGEVQWLKSEYKMGDTGTFTIIDPDVNLNPNLIDIFKVRVWSDSDAVGTEVTVIETGPATGIFSGDIQFGTKTVEGAGIKVVPGDSVCLEYVDRTLPYPHKKGDFQKITGYTKIC